ncbi:hypothetical protein D9M73_242930 [compost metagenome]
MVVRRRGTAGEQQLGQRHLGGQGKLIGCQARPHRVERLQPGEQRLVHHRRPGAGEGLVEVVVGVDQAGRQHMLAGVEYLFAGSAGLLAGGDQLDDATVLHDEAATGVEAVGSEDGEGIAQPEAGG